MAKEKKKSYAEMSREERVTGKPPLKEVMDPKSREYMAKHYKKGTE